MHKSIKVEVRNLQNENYAQLSQSFKRVYANKDVSSFRTLRSTKKCIRPLMYSFIEYTYL